MPMRTPPPPTPIELDCDPFAAIPTLLDPPLANRVDVEVTTRANQRLDRLRDRQRRRRINEAKSHLKNVASGWRLPRGADPYE